MSAKSNQLPDGFYVSRSKETSVLKAAANGHLSVWPSAQVVVAGSTAIFFKEGKKVWDVQVVYAAANFELTPLRSGWFTDQYNKAGTGHFMVVDGPQATSLCGRRIEAENLQSEAECLKLCAKCKKAHAQLLPATA